MKKHLIGFIETIFIVIVVAFIVLQVYLDLSLPGFMSQLTEILKAKDIITNNILKIGGQMLIVALLSAGCSVIIGCFMALLSSRVTMHLRGKIYTKVLGLDVASVKKFNTASLINRTTNDVRQVGMLIGMGLNIMVKAPVMATWAVFKIAGKSWQWSLATLIGVVLMLLLFIVIVVFVVPKFKLIQKKTDMINNVSRENLSGIRVVHAFNAEQFQQDKFEAVNTDLTKTHLFVQRLTGLVSPFMSVIMNGLTIAIYIVGAVLINAAQDLQKLELFADMVVFSSYAMQIVISFMMLAIISLMLPRAVVSIKRIKEVLNEKNEIIDGNFVNETVERGTLKLVNVGFKYPGSNEYVLENITFQVEPGETVAIIGSTASGKSTLVNLIPRFYDVTEGEIYLDGINIKDYPLEQVYNKIGYISQTAQIVSGTIGSNVVMGEINGAKPNKEAMQFALDIAQAREFVDNREDGVNSIINQSGTNLSGGQKQRLSIARAIARKPEILIFDDSFSALDYNTDKLLRNELEQKLVGTTKIIVAQRIGTIKNADKIIVLEKGKLVGMGKHDELLKTCDVYKEIALSQLSEEELNNGTN